MRRVMVRAPAATWIGITLALTFAATSAGDGPSRAFASSAGRAPHHDAQIGRACRTSQLSARFRSGSPRDDQSEATLMLTNHSAVTCHTYGYVGLGLLGYRDKAVPSRILRAREPRPALVVLTPHAQAYALMHWSIVPGRGDSPSGCPIPLRLEVTPPDQRTHLILNWGDRSEVCHQGTISVTALASRR